MSKFRVWIVGDESSQEIVEAFDQSSAAERFVEKYESESADYPVAGGNATVDVVVADDSGEAVFSVSGYAKPVYQARLA